MKYIFLVLSFFSFQIIKASDTLQIIMLDDLKVGISYNCERECSVGFKFGKLNYKINHKNNRVRVRGYDKRGEVIFKGQYFIDLYNYNTSETPSIDLETGEISYELTKAYQARKIGRWKYW